MANTTETNHPWPERPGPDASQSEVEADIARTREHLGETLAQLVENFDIKAQAEHTIEDVKDNAAGAVEEAGHKVSETLAAARDAVQSMFSRNYDTAYSTFVAEPDRTVENDLLLRSRTDWTRVAPWAIASGLGLSAVIAVVMWRRR